MEAIFGTDPIMSKEGEVKVCDTLTTPKIIGLYFSMHDCAPCQDFTPLFAELYNEFNADGKVMEVVFCSGDKTPAEYDMYYAQQPWLALPKGDRRLGDIAKKF